MKTTKEASREATFHMTQIVITTQKQKNEMHIQNNILHAVAKRPTTTYEQQHKPDTLEE